MNEFNTKTTTYLPEDQKTIAVLTHLSGLLASFLGGFTFLGPALFYLLFRDRSPELKAHILESLNFAITTTIINWVLLASMFLVLTIPFALLGLGVVYVAYMVFSIVASVDAANDQLRRYPFTWRLITN